MPSLFHQQLTALFEQGKQNALIYLDRQRSEQRLSMFDENNLFLSLKEIQDRLSLPVLPRRIECYDISHISGKFVYGSMITFVDGRPAKKFYKLFKTKDQNDDYANHREVLTRRLQRYFDNLEMARNTQALAARIGLPGADLAIGTSNSEIFDTTKSELPDSDSAGLSSNLPLDLLAEIDLPPSHPWALPDLLIIDGGKGQLSSDYKVLVKFELTTRVPICSIAKRIEEIFTPDLAEPYLFEGATLFLLQRIRDEAHRFAITANRDARLKTASSSELDGIPGIGPKTKQKLLQVFGSVKNIVKTMDDNPMLLYESVGQNIVEKLKQRFG